MLPTFEKLTFVWVCTEKMMDHQCRKVSSNRENKDITYIFFDLIKIIYQEPLLIE